MSNRTFEITAEPQSHKTRAKAIMKEHPEVRDLVGRNPWSFAVILGGVFLQIGLAILLRHEAWWVVLLVAWFVGAFADHALFVMFHEATHNLVFRGRAANAWAGILCNLPTMIPSFGSFRIFHLKHHAYLGVYEMDTDVPNRWEARLVGNSWWRKALWLALFPVFQITRTFRTKNIRTIDRWVVLNFLVCAAFVAGMWWLFGGGAILYLLASFYFSIGFHPCGGRWIQEHFVFQPGQETYSYYGLLNAVQFQIGHHNEHHDFPSVPWNNLPKVRRAAPKWYDDLKWHRSWVALIARFVFDPKVSMYSRVVRAG